MHADAASCHERETGSSQKLQRLGDMQISKQRDRLPAGSRWDKLLDAV